MNEDWIQLTEDDIERARQLTRARHPMPEVITITPDDIPTEALPPHIERSTLTITQDDLDPTPAQPIATEEVRELEELMFELLNEARQNHLPGWLRTVRLKWHDGLAAVARGHSVDMLRRQYVSHSSLEGQTAGQRLERIGIRFIACGENIGVFYGEQALSSKAVHDIHNAFVNQPRSLTNHRGNLINPIWTHTGIGIAHNPDGSLVATQNFISAPGNPLRRS